MHAYRAAPLMQPAMQDYMRQFAITCWKLQSPAFSQWQLKRYATLLFHFNLINIHN